MRHAPPRTATFGYALSYSDAHCHAPPHSRAHRHTLPVNIHSQQTTATTHPSSLLIAPPPCAVSVDRLQQPFSTSAALQGYRRRMDTYSPSRRVQKRRHGYLARLKTKSGRNILKRRQLKGKRFLSW
ncbi:hypothetical protein DV736_g3540, partial [Chaetothyriales sp. CBS 134916]